MTTHTIPWQAPAPTGAVVRCAGPGPCGSADCFNGATEDAPERAESYRAAERRRWRRTNAGWICPDCVATL